MDNQKTAIKVILLIWALSISIIPFCSVKSIITVPDPSEYTALPVWSDASNINKIQIGEFDISHAGQELVAIGDSGRVTLITDRNYIWTASTLCTIPEKLTMIASGNMDNSTLEDEIAVGTSDGNVYYVYKSGSSWSYDLIGSNFTYSWGTITGLAIGLIDPTSGFEIVVTGTSGKVVVLNNFNGTWTGDTVFLSCYPITDIAIDNVDPILPGNEIVLAVGGTENALILLTPYTGPTKLFSRSWTSSKIWKPELPITEIITGNLDGPLTKYNSISVVIGGKQGTGTVYTSNIVQKNSNGWSVVETYRTATKITASIGDFNKTYAGNEIAIAETSGEILMLYNDHDAWKSPRIWNSQSINNVIIAGDFSSSWTGAEVAMADSLNTVTMLTETKLPSSAISIVTPADGAVVNGKQLVITWVGSKYNGVATVDLYYSLNSNSGPWSAIASDLPASGEYVWTMQGSTEKVWIVAVLRDSIGLVVSDIHTVSRIIDIEPPMITHNQITEAYVNQPLNISATVTDNGEVSAVDIYYRPFGQTDYKMQPLQTRSLGKTDTYSTTIPASEIKYLSIEYYISATDNFGNMARLPDTAPAVPFKVSIIERSIPAPVFDHVVLTPSNVILRVGETTVFSTSSYDASGRIIETVITWSVSGSIGVIDSTGIFTAEAPGQGSVQVTANYYGVMKTASVDILVNVSVFMVHGTVQDTKCVALQSTKVTITSTDSEIKMNVLTDNLGRFALSNIIGGKTYTLTIEKQGYMSEQITGIVSESEYIITLKVISPVSPVSTPVIPPETAPTIVITTVVISFMGLAYFLADPLKYKLFCILVPLYSKIEKDKVLDNFVRGQVYGHIKTNPGTHYSKIRRVLGIKNGSLAYHLKTLERGEFIKSKFDGKFKRFYPCGMMIPDDNGTTLSDPQVKIIDVVRKNPGITQSAIGKYLNITKQNINYHIKQLVRAELLHIVEVGRETRCYES